ncbi:hypothetical protein [Mycolicibacterium neworleansense]|uniref:Putative alanine and proline rich protein n=1 Tax=Mycolicibacterium neworleansense TaxID=146018 RepID=A0A0H5S4D4_9MYCO|nr:hypothetical protein [Mycolicibacterium neworleansense]MCV7365190.1 hypothetical protein [Mycolicibacterium neworleansense]CRZ15994.1 putative alanine and proline rich protein [Mycolicibacterium neworleansense]
MVQTGDVAGRLDQGQSAVETIAELVWACGLLGYQHPDLTAHAGQVHDWYATEDGLDLRMLDADCTALAAAAGTAEQALRLQDDQPAVLDGAWQGRGAQAAREFLLRHGSAAQQTVVAVRRAADTVAALRDQLWRAVDTKVGVTERIEARCAAQREQWLAAARTVRAGLGDRDAASELIDARVKPFVDTDVGGEWVPAMRAATAAVADAYAAAIAALADGPPPVFAIPGDLGPSWTPRAGATAESWVGSARTAPAGFVPSVGSGPAPAMPSAGSVGMAPSMPQIASTAPTFAPPPLDPATPAVAPAAGTTAADPASAWGSSLGAGLPGAGLSGAGSGVSGLGRQLADLFGGLIGSSDSGSSGLNSGQLDAPEISDEADEPGSAGESDDEEELEPDDEEDVEPDDEAPPEDDEATDVAVDDETAAVDPVAAPVPEATAVEPPAEPQAAQPAVVPPAVPEVAPAAKTPCEIAADELPQVGG